MGRTSSTPCCSKPTRNGRFSHLELARADGLWTFHPEPDGTLHGNHVATKTGVRHVVGRPFAPDDALLIEGSPISKAAIAWRHATADPGLSPVAGVVIGTDGTLAERSEVRLERLSATRWQVGEGSPIEIDDAGLPAPRRRRNVAARARLTPVSWIACGQCPATARSSRQSRG